MNVCIYLRKSRSEENLSVEEVLSKHRTTLLAYAQKNNYNILEIKEEVVSGESISRRPQMLELLREVEDNKYDAVLVMDIDRLGRGNMREQGLILETFKEYNTKIITPRKVYDLDNEFDEEFSEFEAFMARRELKIIKKRLQRGRLKSLEEGNYISPYAPYGYKKLEKTLVIDDEEAKIVKLIFDLYVNSGYGDTKIAKYLTQNSIPNKNGNLNWDKTTIRKMIQNPVYIGKVTWNKRVYKYKEDSKRTSKFKDKSQWNIYEGKHNPIVEEDIFNQAQKLTKSRYTPHIHKNKKLRNPLANLLKCGACGATMTIRTAKGKHDSIRCYKHCGGIKSSYIYLVEERLLNMALHELERVKFEFEFREDEIDNTELKVLEAAIERSTKKLNLLKQQKNKLYDLLEQGIYDNDTFLNRMNTLSAQIDYTNKDIETAHKKLFNIQKGMTTKKDLMPQIDSSIKFINDIYYRLDAAAKNNFLKTFIDKVIYTKEKDADQDDFKLDVFFKL
ncbi:recombinase family protein [Crassaminicella profunda]|uniref:recombinase family protein n=1 Tax=Crassaminicella profunda TaxID=1286698 RepID=UPI001CA63449|nr:recombinase family protein [Crassaminicella profunda]QZY53790.1 recombinase family protein [Crassaminicella profunda]